MTATIVITTKNRKTDLVRALASCLRQSAQPEILVIDDASTDGTPEMVREQFPSVRLVRLAESRGYIYARNAAAQLACGEIIVSIDDDAEFSEPEIVENVLREIAGPNIAAVAMPFIDVNLDGKVRQSAPDADGVWITNEFIGTAHAIRKTVFQEAGGYREILFHQGEEGDLCLRLLERGWHVRLGTSAPILHYHSPQRSQERMNLFGQRNLMLFAWHNVPMPEFVPHLLATTFNGLVWGIGRSVFTYRLRGAFRGISAMMREFSARRPVSRKTYRLYRRLKTQGPMTLPDIVKQFPA